MNAIVVKSKTTYISQGGSWGGAGEKSVNIYQLKNGLNGEIEAFSSGVSIKFGGSPTIGGYGASFIYVSGKTATMNNFSEYAKIIFNCSNEINEKDKFKKYLIDELLPKYGEIGQTDKGVYFFSTFITNDSVKNKYWITIKHKSPFGDINFVLTNKWYDTHENPNGCHGNFVTYL
jgi:hypothetical protein